MKTIILITVLSCILQFTTFTAYSQDWEYSSVILSADWPMTSDIKIDKNKNFYVASNYRHMTIPVLLESNGYNDIFVAKYDSTGGLLWMKNFGGNNPAPAAPDWIAYSENVSYMHIDTLNNLLYATGYFYNSIQFDSTTLNSFTPNKQCPYLFKMDLNGNIVWAKRMLLNIYSISTDLNGNIFLSGGVSSIAQFDSLNVIESGSVIVKLNQNGDFLWVKKISNWINDFTIKGIISYNSEVFINGYTNKDTILIDTIVKYVPSGSKWSALACFDNNGNAKWLSLYGGDNSLSGYDFSMDNEGNSYTTGYFTGTGYFGNDTITSTAGQKNMFLAKHDITGNMQWVRQINATSSEGYCVSNVVDSILYVSGFFRGTANFNTAVTSATTQDMFIAKYNKNGDCLLSKNFGKAKGQIVVQDNTHAAYITGVYSTNITIGNDFYNSTDGIYIAKLKGDTTTSIEQRKNIIKDNLLTIYANPNTGKCNITIPEEFNYENNLILQIFDKSGKIIQQSKVEVLEDNIKVNIESEAKGIYNVVLSNGVKSYGGKIVFE